MRCFCFLHNTLDRLADGDTPYERRFKMTLKQRFKGFTFYPFGCEIRYKPSSPKVLNQMAPFGSKTLPGVFIGYHEHKGGYFSGDLMIADWEDIWAADRVSDIPIRRLPYQEVYCTKRSGK